MSAICSESLVVRNVNTRYVQIRIESFDNTTATSRVVFNKTIPLILVVLFIPLAVLAFPILLLFVICRDIFLAISERPIKEPTYLEAKELLKGKSGYLSNLSDAKKEAVIHTKNNSPLGL